MTKAREIPGLFLRTVLGAQSGEHPDSTRMTQSWLFA
jgi:hypothetical protein